MEIKLESTYKGTRILFGDLAKKKRDILNKMSDILILNGYQEVMIPIIQKQETFSNKVGNENQNMMFSFKDRGDRDICLSPEYTAVIQQMSSETFKYQKDIKMFYIGECFRGEKPQMGRYRQFTQLGVEILNPTKDYSNEIIDISKSLMDIVTKDYEVSKNVTRGLDYYKNGVGFEISCPQLGAQKQVCGGGSYDGGIGFAIGIDRLLII
jgi:histidyl-tRNA synthetase